MNNSTKTPETIHRQIFNKDQPPPGPHGWIQWKGTNVCMDVRCACGHLTHVDADFCYYLKCGYCGALYSVGAHVSLHPLTAEEIHYVNTEGNGFVKSE